MWRRRSRLANLGLVLVFAEAAGRRPVWQKALEGWNVVESQIVTEWQNQAKAEMLLLQMKTCYGEVPRELADAILQAQHSKDLDRWAVAFVTAATLEQFRQATGL